MNQRRENFESGLGGKSASTRSRHGNAPRQNSKHSLRRPVIMKGIPKDDPEAKAKPDNRKEFRFPTTLNKIVEVDETRLRSSHGNVKKDSKKNLKWKPEEGKSRERPRSIGSVRDFAFGESDLKKRLRSSCALLQKKQSEVGKFRKRPRSAGGNPFEITERDTGCPRWCDVRHDGLQDLLPPEELPLRPPPSSARESRAGSCLGACGEHFVGGKNNWMMHFCYCGLEHHLPGKCRSNPNFSKNPLEKCQKAFGNEKDFQKFKRSLKLLGFQLSDFGICGGETKSSTRWRPKLTSSTFSTKIASRSISLESLRQAVRRAWVYDGLDVSHRRLMAQAAYEQWYFKKKEEILKKQDEEKKIQLRMKESLEKELDKKKKKAEEEFRKWTQRKRTKRKEMEKKSENTFCRLVKTKEESEKAFLKWKKKKDKELMKRNKEKKKDEQKEIESERQKNEKRAIAEKAFQQWKSKLEENQKKEAEKRIRRNKRHEEMERRNKREEGSRTSFQVWKSIKDEEIKRKLKRFREAVKQVKEERLTQMEERMYEAEQAFEEWLEKVDERRQKQFSSIHVYQKKMPWLPV